jgi:hypothetical protein
VRRRRRRLPEVPPETLCRFVPSEWPGAVSLADAWSRWSGARFGWWLDHPDDPPLPEDPQEDEWKRRFGEGAW